MPLSVKWDGGVAVNNEETSIIFDPTSSNQRYNEAFITHSHFDHSRGFLHPYTFKFSTYETLKISRLYTPRCVDGWKPVRCRVKMKVEDLYVEARNAGHILGSVLYEVISSEGNLVYTGDLNPAKTLTMEEAEAIPCDILIIDATFGSPSFIFPSREELSVDIAKWVLKTIKGGRTPTFQTDTIGNAQELIFILNKMTNLPVITHPRVSAVNRIYESRGYNLSYLDAPSDEAAEVARGHEYVLVLPKRAKLPQDVRVSIAFASGWALYLRDGREPFPLSDHADYRSLMEYISEVRPKVVLTFHGGKRDSILAKHIERRLGIEARPLRSGIASTPERERKEAGYSFRSCERDILKIVKIRGFTYSERWISRTLQRRGYARSDVVNALDRLTKSGVLRLINPDKEYELR